MTIAATTGKTVNNSTAGTSLVFASAATTTGQAIVVAVAILNTTVSVSSITSTSGSVFTLKAAQNDGSSSIRAELWECQSVAGNAAEVITVTFSAATLASAAWEEYSGSSALGHVGTGNSGLSNTTEADVTTQDNGSFAVCAVAMATSSGDTLGGNLGTVRQSLVPALTTASIAIIDNTSAYAASVRDSLIISTSRAWASAALELRTGVSPLSVTNVITKVMATPTLARLNHQRTKAESSYTNTPSFFALTPIASAILSGTIGVAYSETISAQGGTAPYTFAVTSGSLPTGLSLNTSTGIISGTPTAAGSFTFNIEVTDTNGNVGIHGFTITIATSPSGGNFGWVG